MNLAHRRKFFVARSGCREPFPVECCLRFPYAPGEYGNNEGVIEKRIYFVQCFPELLYTGHPGCINCKKSCCSRSILEPPGVPDSLRRAVSADTKQDSGASGSRPNRCNRSTVQASLLAAIGSSMLIGFSRARVNMGCIQYSHVIIPLKTQLIYLLPPREELFLRAKIFGQSPGQSILHQGEIGWPGVARMNCLKGISGFC